MSVDIQLLGDKELQRILKTLDDKVQKTIVIITLITLT